MNNFAKYFLLSTASLAICLMVSAQSGVPDSLRVIVGKPLIVKQLAPISNYPENELSLQGRRKKGLILDFWSERCSACVESFPKVDALYRKYKDSLDFVLIGLDNGSIQTMYSKLKKKMRLVMPYAFDSTIFRNLGIHVVPTILWIDTMGIVRGIASSGDLNTSNMEDFIHGRPLTVGYVPGRDNSDFIYNKPLLIRGNGGPDTSFLYRSVLTGYNAGVPSISPPCIKQIYCRNQIMVGNAGLSYLYDLAYGDTVLHTPSYNDSNSYGKYWLRPILELKDSSLFVANYISNQNQFCYNANVPPERATTQLLQTMMQNDLSSYFGYQVSTENRFMPCWNLVSTPAARKALLSKGNKRFVPNERNAAAGFTMINSPVKKLIGLIWAYHQLEPPIIDETGIAGNIDITMDCLMTDWQDLKRALNLQGLDLVPGKAIMKVIVIRDSQSLSNE